MQIDNNPFWDSMTRGGMNFTYAPLCVSIASEVILSIAYKVMVSNIHEGILGITYKVIVSITHEAILNYCQKVG